MRCALLLFFSFVFFHLVFHLHSSLHSLCVSVPPSLPHTLTPSLSPSPPPFLLIILPSLPHLLPLSLLNLTPSLSFSITLSPLREWQKHEVPLPHIHRCHLLDYEQKLLSVILSHCHYSLRVGHSHDVSYDLPLLEKHLLDHFVFGKPRILLDIPQVVYRRDVYTAATFAAIRDRVRKQVM